MHVLGLTDMRVDEMRDPFEELGARGTLVSIDPEDGVGAYVGAFRTASECVDRRESDAILAYNGSGLVGVVGALLGRRHDVPFLIRQNGDVLRQHRETAVEQIRGREWRALAAHLPFALLSRATFGRADGFVPVTETLTATIHRQTGCPTDRIAAAPNPIRAEAYAPPEGERERGDAADGGDGGPRLVTVTNLDFRGKYEGVTRLLDGIVPLLRRRSGVEYVIAGDGRYHRKLRTYLDETVASDVRDRIRAPGFVDDVAELYWSGDVFVYASSIDGYPNVTLEAQAAGLPIVTNPAYGIAEQIDDGESGLFVDPSDPDEVADAIGSLLDDPDERARLGRNARDRVVAENDPAVVASRLSDAVRTVVAALPDRAIPNEESATRPATGPPERGRSRRTDAPGGGTDDR